MSLELRVRDQTKCDLAALPRRDLVIALSDEQSHLAPRCHQTCWAIPTHLRDRCTNVPSLRQIEARWGAGWGGSLRRSGPHGAALQFDDRRRRAARRDRRRPQVGLVAVRPSSPDDEHLLRHLAHPGGQCSSFARVDDIRDQPRSGRLLAGGRDNRTTGQRPLAGSFGDGQHKRLRSLDRIDLVDVIRMPVRLSTCSVGALAPLVALQMGVVIPLLGRLVAGNSAACLVRSSRRLRY